MNLINHCPNNHISHLLFSSKFIMDYLILI